MANIVVVGAQWGDEAKGKIVDYLAEHADMVVRYGGGNNAGHSVTLGTTEYKFHLIPCGILRPETVCVVSDGVVIDPAILVSELRGLESRGVALGNLHISGAAHVILPYHRLFDELDEQRRGGEKIGTTGRGIGPVYADKAARCGIRMGEFVDPERFAQRLRSVLEVKNEHLTRLYGVDPLDPDAVLAEYSGYADVLRKFVGETSDLIYRSATEGRGVIFEGAQGTLLDIDLGTYPYVTSSHPIAGGACLGTGIGPTLIDGAIGVAKSYTTRVGAGVFPTELCDAIGDTIRERGHEYGTTTGRPRRCGWLDAVILRYSARVNGLSCFALGHLDVLSGLDYVNICVDYLDGSGRRIEHFPSDLSFRTDIEPIYEALPGWSEELGGVKRWDDLPRNARNYVERIAALTGIPIGTLSVGPAREQTIVLNEPLIRSGVRRAA